MCLFPFSALPGVLWGSLGFCGGSLGFCGVLWDSLGLSGVILLHVILYHFSIPFLFLLSNHRDSHIQSSWND